MIKLIKYSFLLLGFMTCAQNTTHSVNVTASSEIKNLKIITYNPTIKIKKKYKDIKQAKNKTPEQLLRSWTSANSMEWDNWNNGNKTLPEAVVEFNKKHYEKKKASKKVIDTNKYFKELLQESYFEYDNKKYCWVKFYAHTDFKHKRGYDVYVKTFLLRFQDKRWILDNSYIEETILRDKGNFKCYKHDLIINICTKQNPDKNPYMAKLLDKVYEEGDALDLNILYAELNRMYAESKQEKTEELKYFEEEKI